MECKNLKELEKLIALLRKKGVKSFKSGELALELGPEIKLSSYRQKKNEKEALTDEGEFTPEQALFWSADTAYPGAN